MGISLTNRIAHITMDKLADVVVTTTLVWESNPLDAYGLRGCDVRRYALEQLKIQTTIWRQIS